MSRRRLVRRPLMGRLLVGLLVGALLAGCGLPLADGVERPGEVPAEQRLSEPISVLPPGPQPGATPEAIVFGFLAAQSSAQDDHGIARRFLAPAQSSGWHDDAGVTVFDPRTATASAPQPDGEGLLVSLRIDVVGSIAPDGTARVHPRTPVVQHYRLHQEPDRQWRLVQVPPGLTLSPAGRDRAFDALSVFFLAPPGPLGSTRHLVADLVQLPADADRAQLLVERLLAGPSRGLADSAQTAVPAGTRLLSSVRLSAAGETTVDLSRQVAGLADAARQELSAQLVWTLRQVPAFTRLRLLVEGQPLGVSEVGSPQPRTAWAQFSPEGTVARPPGLALVDGQLRELEPPREDRPPVPLTDTGRIVDFAVDPRLGGLAVLTEQGSRRTLRTGPLIGPLGAGWQDVGLRSPTWGSGDLGVWLLRTGARPAVLRLPGGARTAPVQVAVEGLPALDRAAVLRVSRDGVRVALVARGVLRVGRVVVGDGPVRVVDLRVLARHVRDVAWSTGTSLAVLVEDRAAPLLPLLKLSVDGTSAVASGLLGVAEGEPVSIAASGEQPLLVETQVGSGSTVYRGDGVRGFEVLLRDASRPAYPR